MIVQVSPNVANCVVNGQPYRDGSFRGGSVAANPARSVSVTTVPDRMSSPNSMYSGWGESSCDSGGMENAMCVLSQLARLNDLNVSPKRALPSTSDSCTR